MSSPAETGLDGNSGLGGACSQSPHGVLPMSLATLFLWLFILVINAPNADHRSRALELLLFCFVL